jgi:hypothetical protein
MSYLTMEQFDIRSSTLLSKRSCRHGENHQVPTKEVELGDHDTAYYVRGLSDGCALDMVLLQHKLGKLVAMSSPIQRRQRWILHPSVWTIRIIRGRDRDTESLNDDLVAEMIVGCDVDLCEWYRPARQCVKPLTIILAILRSDMGCRTPVRMDIANSHLCSQEMPTQSQNRQLNR